MTQRLQRALLILLSPGLLLVNACENDKKPVPKQEAAFTVSGAINAEKSGVATVYFFESGDYNFMDISIHDGIGTDQTVSLDFFIGPSDQPVEVPAVGTYPIGPVAGSDTKFWMVYTNTETGQEYGSEGKIVGTLTIEAITKSYIKGSFEFEAPEKAVRRSTVNPGIMVQNGHFTALLAN